MDFTIFCVCCKYLVLRKCVFHVCLWWVSVNTIKRSQLQTLMATEKCCRTICEWYPKHSTSYFISSRLFYQSYTRYKGPLTKLLSLNLTKSLVWRLVFKKGKHQFCLHKHESEVEIFRTEHKFNWLEVMTISIAAVRLCWNTQCADSDMRKNILKQRS